MALFSQDDPKARAILDNCSKKFKETTSKIDFSLKIEDTKTEKQQTVKGNIVVKGKKFKLTVPTVHTYYDGKTQYVHMLKNKEVSLTTPILEDLQLINPAYLITSYTKQSTVQFSLDNKASSPNYIIDVFPDYKIKKEYYKAIVIINKKTNDIISIKVLNRNGVHTRLKVINNQKNLMFNDAFFVFDFKTNPDVITNDLR